MDIRPNLEALHQLIVYKKLDALVCMSPENFTYLAGAYITTLKTIRPRYAFAILTRRNQSRAIVCGIEEALVRVESWMSDVSPYIEFRDDPITSLAESLVEIGLANATIGLDLDYVPAAAFARLSALLPNAQFVDTTEAVAAVRAIKTAAEVAWLEKTTRETHRAIVEALAESCLGDTDQQIANRIIKRMFDWGASGVQHFHLASGPRTPQIHNAPSPDETRISEILRLDVGGTYGAYASDVARTYSTGEPRPMHREVYRNLCEVQAQTIAAMRPGVTAGEVFDICSRAFADRGLPCTLPHVGHSFGIEAHERPMIRPGEDTVLAPGMVINIEPLTQDADGNLYHTEDLVVITEEGTRLLTHGLAPLEIPVLGQALTLA
jgi:Xaa-Pro dipeptidase